MLVLVPVVGTRNILHIHRHRQRLAVNRRAELGGQTGGRTRLHGLGRIEFAVEQTARSDVDSGHSTQSAGREGLHQEAVGSVGTCTETHRRGILLRRGIRAAAHREAGVAVLPIRIVGIVEQRRYCSGVLGLELEVAHAHLGLAVLIVFKLIIEIETEFRAAHRLIHHAELILFAPGPVL